MADTLPRAEIIHTMPGRTRLRIADRSGDRVFFASIATGLSTIAGITSVDVKPLTGSVLIRHASPLKRIAEAAKTGRLFIVADAAAPPPSAPAVKLDPKFVAAAGLGALALMEFARGRILPPAFTLAWYAASLSGLLLHDPGEGGE